jgi:hypothetical protein
MTDPAPERTTGADGNDVETAKGASLPSNYQEITRRVHEVSQLHVIDGLDGVHEGSPLPGPHLHENNNPFFQGNDVDLSRRAQVVPLEDAVTAEQKIPSRCSFTTFAGTDVGGFTLEEHMAGNARKGPES